MVDQKDGIGFLVFDTKFDAGQAEIRNLGWKFEDLGIKLGLDKGESHTQTNHMPTLANHTKYLKEINPMFSKF